MCGAMSEEEKLSLQESLIRLIMPSLEELAKQGISLDWDAVDARVKERLGASQ